MATVTTAERDPMTDAYWLAERDRRVEALETALREARDWIERHHKHDPDMPEIVDEIDELVGREA